MAARACRCPPAAFAAVPGRRPLGRPRPPAVLRPPAVTAAGSHCGRQSLREADERRSAATRIVHHYLHSAQAAARLATGEWDVVDLPPLAPDVVVEQFEDDATARDWLAVERPVLVAAVEHAVAHGWPTQAWQLARSLFTTLMHTDHADDLFAMNRVALAAAATWDSLGFAYHRLGDRRAAVQAWTTALRLLEQIGHPQDDAVRRRLALPVPPSRAGVPALPCDDVCAAGG